MCMSVQLVTWVFAGFSPLVSLIEWFDQNFLVRGHRGMTCRDFKGNDLRDGRCHEVENEDLSSYSKWNGVDWCKW
jgi:hypothetical protein